jgi:hypothetical protein
MSTSTYFRSPAYLFASLLAYGLCVLGTSPGEDIKADDSREFTIPAYIVIPLRLVYQL